ncbi:gamma-secretase subunit Aph-1 [Oratosquilla oratoria]|uniref:gamma-secretase subunit Aph-1 n=1 Tax=Oratosquilla oratoria TaxID=337810 RepID=UPI003F76B209
MTIMQFFGCGLIAFGPPLAMFAITIARDPIRTIMMVASSFFWLLALLLSSMLYTWVWPLKDTLVFGVVFSVLFQELFRFLWFILICKAEGGLKKVSEGNVQIVENKNILAYVSGLGFGMISGAFSLVNVLADMTGPGTVGIEGDPQNFLIASTVISLAFILLHIFWGILFFNALHRRNYLQLAYVVLCHLLASCITLVNPMYSVSIPTVWVLTLLSGVLAFIVAGGSPSSLKLAIRGRSRALQVAVD